MLLGQYGWKIYAITVYDPLRFIILREGKIKEGTGDGLSYGKHAFNLE
jgi:hypothetical protein